MWEDIKNFIPRSFKGAIVVLFAMSWAPSFMYDYIWKPGASSVTQWLLNFFTLGSQTMQDAIYESAALDPTALPALVTFMLIALLPAFLLTLVLAGLFIKYILPKYRSRPDFDALTEEQLQVEYDKKKRSLLKVEIIGALYATIICIAGFVAMAMVNQSVAVWRTFHANLAICRPHMSEVDELNFKARFASMNSRTDYVAIAKDLKAIADSHNAKFIGNGFKP